MTGEREGKRRERKGRVRTGGGCERERGTGKEDGKEARGVKRQRRKGRDGWVQGQWEEGQGKEEEEGIMEKGEGEESTARGGRIARYPEPRCLEALSPLPCNPLPIPAALHSVALQAVAFQPYAYCFAPHRPTALQIVAHCRTTRRLAACYPLPCSLLPVALQLAARYLIACGPLPCTPFHSYPLPCNPMSCTLLQCIRCLATLSLATLCPLP